MEHTGGVQEVRDRSVNMAVLVDGDNTRQAAIGAVEAAAAAYGTVTVRWVYGDWTSTTMAGWRESLHLNGYQPVQQFSNRSGKNATDSALIIGAMDLMYSGLVGGFCIVSSDSDFTRLATRIREQGMIVIGVGEKNTPQSFVKACTHFFFLPRPGESPQNSVKEGKEAEMPKDLWAKFVTEAIIAVRKDDGWASLSDIGLLVRRRMTKTKTKMLPGQKLSSLIDSRPQLFAVHGDMAHRKVSLVVPEFDDEIPF